MVRFVPAADGVRCLTGSPAVEGKIAIEAISRSPVSLSRWCMWYGQRVSITSQIHLLDLAATRIRKDLVRERASSYTLWSML